MLKINDCKVKIRFKPARFICDVLSAGLLFVLFYLSASFTAQIAADTWDKSYLWAWAFPAAGAAAFSAYVFIVFKDRAFKKFDVKKENAQAVFDEFTFCAALVKLPLFLIIFEGFLIFEEAMFGKPFSFFNVRIILYILLIVIIIRFSLHRIRTLTKKQKSSESNSVKVKARTLDDDEKEK